MKVFVVRLQFSVELSYQITQPGSDFIFNIQAAQTGHQTVISESLMVSQNLPLSPYTDPVTHTRFLRLKAARQLLRQQVLQTDDLRHREGADVDVWSHGRPDGSPKAETAGDKPVILEVFWFAGSAHDPDPKAVTPAPRDDPAGICPNRA